ncbi:HypC/HybG/HupF family hydrogenase formation chaperone [Aggregatilinea lenta]|uniref:HypC/HybG/HupF family hydrogenase formation chaperone n=1 Tax=Aggregatilinea lenta TaxID=913108 RepID=UPI000E5B0E45|nr:HypC/HybG/HupF family hydrogenase formation chaperone [Aggregatilinea lenta]
MCLGIPGKIVEIYEQHGLRMGKVDFGGVIKEACLAYVPEAQIGDYTIIHVGFALNVIDEVEAQKTLQLMIEVGILDEELGESPDEDAAR